MLWQVIQFLNQMKEDMQFLWMRNHFCSNLRKFQIELDNHIIMGLVWGHSVWFSRLWESQIETPECLDFFAIHHFLFVIFRILLYSIKIEANLEVLKLSRRNLIVPSHRIWCPVSETGHAGRGHRSWTGRSKWQWMTWHSKVNIETN